VHFESSEPRLAGMPATNVPRQFGLHPMVLSGERAGSAVNYIAGQGIDRKRMTAIGYGESKLLNKCACEGSYVVKCTEEEHAVNRRTEFKIMKF